MMDYDYKILISGCKDTTFIVLSISHVSEITFLIP